MARWLPAILEERREFDDFDEDGPEWKEVFPTVMQLKPLTGRELVNAMKKYDKVTHQVTVRYEPGYLATRRLKYDERYFHIAAVINVDEENRYLKLMVSE